MTEHPVLIEVQQSALWIRLNRPQAMNALTPAVLAGMEAALDQALESRDIHAVVITGTGSVFCAGADLSWIRSGNAANNTSAFLQQLLATLNRVDHFPKPVIAAINGLTLAGGLELVLCCDLVLAARSARIGDAHANYGLIPGGGASVRLPRAIGVTRAKYLMLTGEWVSAETMLSAGLVNRVVNDEALAESTQALVDQLARKSPLGLQRMLELVDRGWDQPLELALQAELQVLQAHAQSNDMQEGLTAFGEKRQPVFKGR
jgi:enoyl-CoA hydratase